MKPNPSYPGITNTLLAVLACLITRLGHRRRGVGTLLVKWGIEQAEKDGLPAYVEASPLGLPVYRKCGMEIAAEPFVIDLRHMGAQAVSRIERLSRWPPGPRKVGVN